MKTEKGQALLIKHRNEVGIGAKMFKVLGDNGINVGAFSACGRGAQVEFSLLVGQRLEEAKQTLRATGYVVESEDVLLLYVPDVPGAMAAALQQLAMVDIDVDYAYCSSAKQTRTLVVIKTADIDGAARELAGLEIHDGA